jgi:hypothetical protein
VLVEDRRSEARQPGRRSRDSERGRR